MAKLKIVKNLRVYWRRIGSLLFTILILTVSLLVIHQELQNYSWQEITVPWQTIPKSRKLGAIALTGLGYLIMTGYDFLGFSYLKQKLAPVKIAFTAFVSHAVGNTVGFTAVSEAAIRYRFYSASGVTPLRISKLIIFLHLSFWLGICAVGGIILTFSDLTFPSFFNLPFNSGQPVGIILLVLVSIYFSISVAWKKPFKFKSEAIILPNPSISTVSILISALDWGLASSVLYLFLPIDFSQSYFSFLGIYLMGMVAGLVSTVPGGLGVFETVILLLRPKSVSTDHILSALLAYRSIYYFLPFLVAIILFTLQSWRDK